MGPAALFGLVLRRALRTSSPPCAHFGLAFTQFYLIDKPLYHGSWCPTGEVFLSPLGTFAFSLPLDRRALIDRNWQKPKFGWLTTSL
ncbi:hypothetical protein FPV67DRAFT_1486189 [Lyophyllum atratum]|nr:hypothetical protein FPV67DRAFT_1486189 [Lyophyllum atratum]